MHEVSWHFVHSFTSYSRLSGATFAFVLYYHDTVTHVLESDGQIGPITIRIGCSPTVFSRLSPQPLLSVPKPQAVAPEKEIHIEWGSHRGNRGVFRRLGRFVLQKGHRNVGKLLYQVYRPRRQLCWGINITLPKKRLFSLKIPGLFSPCSTNYIWIPVIINEL